MKARNEDPEQTKELDRVRILYRNWYKQQLRNRST